MCDYDAEILRLNEKIKQLMWRVEQSDFEKSSNIFSSIFAWSVVLS